MRTIVLLALASTSVMADPAIQATERLRQIELDMTALPDQDRGGNTNVCGSAPLPLTPTGPQAQITWRCSTFDADEVQVTVWRIPCSPTDSMVVLTLVPIANGPDAFICPPRITLLQSGGLQTTEFNLRNDPPTISSFCGGVIQPVTIALFPRSSTPAAFDFDQGFTIAYEGGNTGTQPVAITAYDPSQYAQIPQPGPNSVEVHVRGSGAHYRNCTVTQSPQGGGIQYTASCNDESPLKGSKFERFDY